MAKSLDLRKFLQIPGPDEALQQQDNLRLLWTWAVQVGKVELPAFAEMWRQHQLLNERLHAASTENAVYKEQWSVPGVSGTVIQKALFTDSKLYGGAADWLYLYNHCALKSMNEAVVESMGSVLDAHAVGKRGLSMEKYVAEAIIHWNGPCTGQCNGFLSRALDVHFKGEPWHFTSQDKQQRYRKFAVSEVLDRLAKEESKLPFLV
jgi:hypothetical protein